MDWTPGGLVLCGAGITVSTSARIYYTTFADQLIVSDGVNRPWAWDGTAHGGLTVLTNAPLAAYGPPRVYYAKLFFVKASERGFNNAWTLGQTDQNQLFGL